jgi:hypothetical protein
MVRVTCPHCASAVLLIFPPEEHAPVVCPRCRRSFVPDEEEWVDPEDG